MRLATSPGGSVLYNSIIREEAVQRTDRREYCLSWSAGESSSAQAESGRCTTPLVGPGRNESEVWGLVVDQFVHPRELGRGSRVEQQKGR